VAYHGNSRRRSLEEVTQLAQSPNYGKGNRKTSTTADLYGSMGGESASLHDNKDVTERVILKDPAALARLWERILDPEVGITLDTQRYYFRTYQDTFQGCKLVDWLICQDIHTSRAQAVAIGQALLTAGFIGSVSNQEVFVDGSDLYQPGERPVAPASQDAPDGDSQEQDLTEPLWLQELADSPFFTEKRTSNSSKASERHRSGDNLSGLRSKQAFTRSFLQPQVDVSDLRENFAGHDDKINHIAEDAFGLSEVYRKHESAYLDRVGKGNGLTEEWRGILQSLADEAVRTISTDSKYPSYDMDIRCYVKVKCVVGGNKLHSRLIPGEVCTLKLTHQDMATQLLKPRIALVANSIVFQREENRMISLDTLTMQEEEYIKKATQKLLQSKPNVILVEKTVSRLAQDIFRKEGISLALNVKESVLDRLERLTGAKKIESIDSMLTAPTLGTCQSFYVENSVEGSNRRSLLVFDGCSPELGGTIILQGETRDTLVKLKAILKRLLLVKHNWKYEKSFILNEYGWIKQQEIKGENSPEEEMEDETEIAENKSTGCEEDGNQEEINKSFTLSVSPFIKVVDNPLNLEVCEGEEVLELEAEPNNNHRKGSNKTEEQDMHPWCSALIKAKVVQPADSPEFQDSLALFRAAGWRNQSTSKKKELTPMERLKLAVYLPEDHCETLPVLFSSFSARSLVAPNYCVAPWVVNMDLYGNYDISLGGFLENFCFSPDYPCPNRQCSTSMMEHTRRFCHGGGAVSVHMQQLEAPIMSEETDRMMMWKYCTECELITPIVPVTSDTWSLSFAMFLHILIHENQITRRGSDRPDAKCTHSLHQEHLTCFGKLDAVATFKFTSIQMWKLVPPCATPELPEPHVTQDILLLKLKTLKKHGSSVFSSVLEKLHEVKGENTDMLNKLMAAQEADFTEYRARVERLEEQITARLDHDLDMYEVLEILTRDVMLARQQWNKRLVTLYSTIPRQFKKQSSDSTEANNQQGAKKQESDTVKKFISTILPHDEREDELVTSPFPLSTHIISCVAGMPLDAPSPHLVTETEPSSIINYLHRSDAFREFLVRDKEEESGNPHLELQFTSDTAQFYSCSYFTKQFANLRNEIFRGEEEKFLQSLSSCRQWEARGGKSGLLFFKTKDERFILKQMSRFEFQSFSEFAPHYFKYIKQCLDTGTKTLLGKIVGVYKVGYKSIASGKGMKMELLIIENLFYKKTVEKSYDLKGSIRNRLVENEGKDQKQVLLDENLVRASCESPLYINSSDKDLLVQAIKRDTAFLALHHMMDYSLLAGICRTSGELVVGIIDYIRTFTWDKKLETLVKSVKSSGVFGGPAKTPTVINPEFYRKRFTDAMDSYFLLVPD